jgi:TM2 domain-containing membrane protein YozV
MSYMNASEAESLNAEPERNAPHPAWYVVALLFPIVGGIVGVVQFAKGRVGPGIALWTVSAVGVLLALAVLAA